MTDASQTPPRLWLWRSCLLLLAVFLAWQVVSLQVADYYAARAAQGERAATDSALWWDAEQPRALELKALFLRADGNGGKDLPEARALLERAVAIDPARGNVLAMLALLAQETGEPGEPMAELADRLAPVEPRVQRDLARHAFMAEDYGSAVIHVARAMVGAPETATQYYPLLMQMAADPEAREVLQAIAVDPTPFPWWNSFFRHVASNADNLDALRSLVALREASTALPLQEYERNLYINRLRSEGLVAEAYLHWVNGLTPEQLGVLGYLYDGNFQQEFANDSGFGWVVRPPRNSGIRASRSDTYGASSDTALRISFRGKRVRFSHVYQQVFLPVGEFTLRGRVRPDQLTARRGLQWRVSCSAGATGTLGESDLIVGTGDWRDFEFGITVPPACAGQILRLYSAGHRDVDHELTGTVWFDELQIERTP